MRWRPLLWFLLSLLFFIGAAVFWQLGDRWAAEAKSRTAHSALPAPHATPAAPQVQSATERAPGAKFAPQAASTNREVRVARRLSNTSKPLGELLRSEHAILLENALLDTAQGTQLPIPEHLKAQGEPGSYIVQSRRALDDGYRSLLKQAGASIVSYIPNNAYLVRASAAAAQQLAADPRTQSVLAYEPYFKLKEPLLKAAVEQTPLPEGTTLNVVLYADAAQAAASELKKMGFEIVGADTSPFGPVARVKPTADSLPTLARLPGVKEVELARSRVPANDLSLVTLGIADDPQTNVNYLGLSGANVLVNINDFGVDRTHPDLRDRVLLDPNDVNQVGGSDPSGHGTFVAGIIAGDGTKSDTVGTNVQGSATPTVTGQFRGKAPKATLLSLSHSRAVPQRTYDAGVIGGFLDAKTFLFGSVPDFYLQQTAAKANASISQNGWNYGNADYDISAASFDAAVRDSLPLTNGSQPLLYVFAAGNAGGGADDGSGGNPDSILSPATAKNVITVGAVEQVRGITNQVAMWNPIGGTNGLGGYDTNTPWLTQSDVSAEVASFSSRGNVGIGLESDYGRFKPDVVAPGSWVVSTRSGQWDEQAYYNPTSHIYNTFPNLVAKTNVMWLNTIFVPANAVGLTISVSANRKSPAPFPDLQIYVQQSEPPTNSYDVLGTNQVTLTAPSPLTVASGWWYGISNPSGQAVSFDLHTDLTVTNDLGNYLDVLSNLNNTLGPWYRYESGSSMAAAAVSGTLALMQEFFTQRLHLTNSPALMKALLINGAQPLSSQYDLQVQKALNAQGWGQVYLPTTVPADLTNSSPATGAPMLFFDQSPAEALATGQRKTFTIKVSTNAIYLPLSATLVWTDPPGDPAAATKLVNDLDLIVTNLDTGAVFYGNDIPAGKAYTAAWSTNLAPNIDVVNNVENVLLPGFGTNYSVTVLARRVNVSAVPDRPDNITQDYALVISSAYGYIGDALTLVASGSILSSNAPLVTFMTNSFVGNPNYSGGVLTNQHVGANPTLLGTNQLPLTGLNANPWGSGANGQLTLGFSNQWHFFVMTNENGFTNAAFMTVDSLELSVPRMGATNVINPENATRTQPDIDLYASTDPNLLALDNNAISNASKSLTRLGNETIVISNAVKGVYYIGVKSEDQMAAQFTFVGVFSLLPFSTGDDQGNQLLQAFVVPNAIPDAYYDNAGRIQPGVATLYAIAPIPIKVHRAIVTNIVTHELLGDLVGTLTHGSDAANLNNHTTNAMVVNQAVVNQAYIYDDSMEHNVPGARQSDGPQTLHNFAGKEGAGQWLFRQADESSGHLGVENDFRIFLEKQQDLKDGIIATIEANSCREDFVDVPNNATNLTIKIAVLGQNSAGPPAPKGPISLTICPLGGVGPSCKTLILSNNAIVLNETNSLSIDIYDTPPLVGGTYSVTTCNQGDTRATVFLQAEITLNTAFALNSLGSAGGPVVIQDNAVTYAYLTNLSHAIISGIDVGMLLSDPRISDLGITLISPNGTRVVLMENRGAGSTNGVGSFVVGTNGAVEQALWSTNLAAFWTSSFESAPVGIYTPGAVFEGWNVLSNSVLVYPQMAAPWLSNNVLMLEYGAVSNALPTTNSTQYQLSFNVTHAPYLVGTVGWWPLDGDGTDLFGGHDGLLSGDVGWSYHGKVDRAYMGDGVATRMVVPACPDLDVGKGRGFSIEGWIFSTNAAAPPSIVWSNSFELEPTSTPTAPAYFAGGWHLDAGSIDLITNNTAGYGTQLADSGTVYVDLNGLEPATISTNLSVTAGAVYRLSFAYAANEFGTPVTAQATINIDGSDMLTIASSNLTWQSTSVVFTASSPLVKLQVASGTPGNAGVFLDSFALTELQAPASRTNVRPLVEWRAPTNLAPQGVQFWLCGLPETNGPAGSLWANIWDTNLQPHLVAVVTNSITNGGWQHVALTYDAATREARIYTNGLPAIIQVLDTTNFIPATSGDLWFGYHPVRPGADLAYPGGLDEFGLYDRALTECEVAAIFQAGSAGKYGTNVLWCPLTNSASAASITVQLDTGSGAQTFYFTNGLTWTNGGPLWETDVVNFTNVLLFASTNGPATNLTSLVFSGGDPNTTVDEVVLSSVVTNFISGYLHFTDNTNFALIPIKYAPTPYTVSNFPPTLIFSNDFENATQLVYQAGSLLPGSTNNPALGAVVWTVTNGPVTVVSNTLVDIVGTNCLALSTNGVLCTLPTASGHRYQLTYSLRGPGAVAWWNGETEPLSRRAWDLIGGNNGAYVNDATNNFRGLVGPHSFYFNGQMEVPPDPDIYPQDIDDPASAIEMADSANLKLTNAFTIEGWIRPFVQTNEAAYCGREQIFFRGFPDVFDCAGAGDPYWLALDETADPMRRNLHFHIGDAQFGSAGFDLFTTNSPIILGTGTNDGWWHIAAVFERPFTNVTVLNTNISTNSITYTTNALRLYLNGVCILTNYTTLCPYADMDPAFSPGVAIGGRSRYDFTQPYRGLLDELTVYGRALTPPELAAIAGLGGKGKADRNRSVAPAMSLAKLNVSIDGVLYDTANGDNARWTTRTVTFTANNTNAVLALQSLLPGTLIDGITLTEIPAELDYLPESPLDALNGEDAYGIWTLELWDNRVGLADVLAMLLNWQINITATPTNPPPVITLAHGLTYTNTLVAHGVQNFVVPMPQWASWSTNMLLFAQQHNNPANPLSAEVWFNTNQMPAFTTNDILLLAGSFASTNLTTNTTVLPYVASGQTYYLTVTNPSGRSIDFAVGVWFDVIPLTNCLSQSNFVSAAGIPRYFQFDVPADDLAAGPPLGNVNFWLSAAQTNVTMVLSQHLPLPDLTHYDYISQWPSTNNEIIMVVSNSTAFAIQTNRWYVGVFNSGPTNVPFNIQACYVTNYPTLIGLTNGVPYFASFMENTNLLAPPGPPRWVFFQFEVTNWTDGLLFELYGLSGNADLLVQRESLPTMAPYFAGSFRPSTHPEQVVVRTSPQIADLRGSWYLGIYNNEVTNVAYTIRAVTAAGSMLLSGQPLLATASPMLSTATPLLAAPSNLLLEWNSIMGEQYMVYYSDTLLPADWKPFVLPNGGLTATTPLSTVPVPIGTNGMRFYRVAQVPELAANIAPLLIQLSGTNQIRLSWPDSFEGYSVQYATGPFGPWLNLNVPMTDNPVTQRWEAYDVIGTGPRYYRLIP